MYSNIITNLFQYYCQFIPQINTPIITNAYTHTYIEAIRRSDIRFIVSLILNLLYNVPAPTMPSTALSESTLAPPTGPTLTTPIDMASVPSLWRMQVAAAFLSLKLLLIAYAHVLVGELHHVAKCVLDRAAARLSCMHTLLGHIRTYSDIPGHTRPYLDILGHTWAYSDISGHNLTYSDILGYTRTYLGIPGHTRTYAEFIQVNSDIHGHSRTYPDLPRHTRTYPDIPGVHTTQLGHTRISYMQ